MELMNNQTNHSNSCAQNQMGMKVANIQLFVQESAREHIARNGQREDEF